MRHKNREKAAVEAPAAQPEAETPEARLAVAERAHKAAVEDLARFENAKADAAKALEAAEAADPVTPESLAAAANARKAIQRADLGRAGAILAEQTAREAVEAGRKAYEADRLRSEVEALPGERDALLAEARATYADLAGRIAAFTTKARELRDRAGQRALDSDEAYNLYLTAIAACEPFTSRRADFWNPLVEIQEAIERMEREAAQKAVIAERENFLQAQVEGRAVPPAGHALPSPNEENRRRHPEAFPPETRTPEQIQADEFAESVRLSALRQQNAASATPDEKVRPSWDYNPIKGAP